MVVTYLCLLTVWCKLKICLFNQIYNYSDFPGDRMIKLCSRCNIGKELNKENFYQNRSQPCGFHSECKECCKKLDVVNNKKYYAANSTRTKTRVKNRRTMIIKFIETYKLGKVCVRCGNNDHRTFEFHHRDPTQKLISIGKVAKRGWSIARINDEISKCDLLCANCHRIVDDKYTHRSEQHKLINDFLNEYKINHPCNCGVVDCKVLEFHHINSENKLFNIGGGKHTLHDLAIEIAKCIVICANCHRIRHYDDIRPNFRRST